MKVPLEAAAKKQGEDLKIVRRLIRLQSVFSLCLKYTPVSAKPVASYIYKSSLRRRRYKISEMVIARNIIKH